MSTNTLQNSPNHQTKRITFHLPILLVEEIENIPRGKRSLLAAQAIKEQLQKIRYKNYLASLRSQPQDIEWQKNDLPWRSSLSLPL